MSDFYVCILKEGGVPCGHVFCTEKPDTSNPDWAKQPQDKTEDLSLFRLPEAFSEIMENFYDMMNVYRRFLPGLIRIAPVAAGNVAMGDLMRFLTANGSIESDEDKVCIFRLPFERYRTFSIHYNYSVALSEGDRIIASSLLVGLISTYDAMMVDLLKICSRRHPEIVINKERNIVASEILRFETVAELREHLISEEVEKVMRDSHPAQFEFIKKKLNFDVREHISEFSDFIEICERRNLLTHTGGIVSRQYRDICKQNAVKGKIPNAGTRVSVNVQYFRHAIATVFRLGMKLLYSLWLKIERDDRRDATGFLNERCFDLIYNELYLSAVALLDFVLEKPSFPIEDRPKKVAAINRANAYRLMGNKEKAKTLVNKEDWSAASPEFRISAAAVREDPKVIAEEIPRSPAAISKEEYRTWPIFREKNFSDEYKTSFNDAYRAVFGEEYEFHSGRIQLERAVEGEASNVITPAASP